MGRRFAGPMSQALSDKSHCGANEGAFSLGTSGFKRISMHKSVERRARSGQESGPGEHPRVMLRTGCAASWPLSLPVSATSSWQVGAGWLLQQRVMSLPLVGALVCLSIRKSSDMCQSARTPCCGIHSTLVLEVLHGLEPTEVCQGGHWPLPFR